MKTLLLFFVFFMATSVATSAPTCLVNGKVMEAGEEETFFSGVDHICTGVYTIEVACHEDGSITDGGGGSIDDTVGVYQYTYEQCYNFRCDNDKGGFFYNKYGDVVEYKIRYCQLPPDGDGWVHVKSLGEHPEYQREVWHRNLGDIGVYGTPVN